MGSIPSKSGPQNLEGWTTFYLSKTSKKGLFPTQGKKITHIGFPPFTGVCRTLAVSTESTYFGDARRGTARLAALAAPTMQRTAEPTSALTARLPWPCSR